MNANQPVASYAVDIVFCIDCTGSMQPYLDSVKDTARTFHARLDEKMRSKGKQTSQLRIRIVAFRDLGEDGEAAFEATEFFTLPADTARFEAHVGTLYADRGDDEPESALEGLVLAIRSPWERTADKRRHVIVLCTDASAHPLGKHSFPTNGQSKPMPTSLAELQSIWGDEVDEGEMEYSAKRLIIFGPKAYPWNEITDLLENSVWVQSAAGNGMQEAGQDAVLEAVAGSV